MANAVFCNVTWCGSCKKRRLGGTQRLHHQGDKNRRSVYESVMILHNRTKCHRATVQLKHQESVR
jgi:hypothetical protein